MPTLFLSTIFSIYYASAQAAPTCVEIPRDTPNPAVSACEDAHEYRFHVVGQSYVYNKEAYQERLRAELRHWLDAAAIAPGSGLIEYWLAVPEANPAATQARVTLRAEGLNLVFFLSLHPDEWNLDDRHVAILEDGSYPDTFGYRPRQLLVKGSGVDPEATRKLLAAHGAYDPQPYTQGWEIYTTAAGMERSVRSQILQDPRAADLVEQVEPNQVFEWIARRERAFSFTLDTGD